MRPMKIVAAVCAFLWLTAGVARGQGVGASGDIRGTVTDPSGAVIPNATVTATDAEKGLKRSTASDDTGRYEITGLAPSVYEVSTEHAGFQTWIQKGVVVSVGQTTTLDFRMKVSGAVESVEVTTAPPVVETERGHQADTITRQFIQDLPINRRDYLTFSLLAPGVTDSTRLATDQDFRVKQTPQSGLCFYASNGRGNSVTVDGGEANDDAGGVRLTLSQEAVKEFQINRSNYSAELGSASGASINIVSQSGSNDLHGGLYNYVRNDLFDARDPFAYSAALGPGQVFNPALPDLSGVKRKDDLSRYQFGGTLGGPISKGKTFLFGSFDGLHQDAQNAVPLLTNTKLFRPDDGTPVVNGVSIGNNQVAILQGLATQPNNPVPCLTGQPAIPAATCAGILKNILTVNPASPLGSFLVNQFENNGGVFPYNTREYFASGRLDHIFSDTNQAYLRYSFGHDNEQSPDVQALTGLSRGSLLHTYDNTLQAAWFHQFSSTIQNELRLQGSYSEFNVIPNAPGEAGLDIAGFANLGTNIFLPNFTTMRRYEAADNLTYIIGHHTMKAGVYELVRGNHTDSHTFFPGRFVFGSLPGGILSPCLQVPAACATSVSSTLLTVTPAVINSLQSAFLGLPQFYQQGFGGSVYNFIRPLSAVYWQDQWQMVPNFTLNFGLRYEMDRQYGVLPNAMGNIAPRVSLAWDPFKDHKTVIRAGYGVFYSPIYGQIDDAVQTLGVVNGFQQIAQAFVPLTGEPGNPSLTSAAVFQTLFAQGKVQCTTPAPGNAACITPADLTQFGINITHAGTAPLSVVFSAQPNYKSPYSQQAELGVEREFAGFAISASYVYVHTLRLPVSIDRNDLPTAPFTTTTAANGALVSFQTWNSPVCSVAVNNPCFANPVVLQNNVYSSIAGAVYQGGILEVNKRFSHHIALMGNYTYSKALDDTTDFNSDYGPVNNNALAGERSLSSFDQRHKVVVTGILGSPWKGRILSGLEVSPIVRYGSSRPFNLLAGGTDLNGDRHYTNDRPTGAGRNTGIGPDYAGLDARLAWKGKLGEKATLQFTAEAFNLVNRTNYASINSTVASVSNIAPFSCRVCSALGKTFDQSGLVFNPAVQPLGNAPDAFVSALGRRQLQFGFHLGF